MGQDRQAVAQIDVRLSVAAADISEMQGTINNEVMDGLNQSKNDVANGLTEIAQMNQRLHSAYTDIHKVQEAVSAVQSSVTGHDEQLILAKNAVDNSQSSIA